MKAAFYEEARRFSVEEKELAPPSQGEVRVKIAYCGICGTDIHVFLGGMEKRTGRHAVIGHECSGVVDEVGEGVFGFQKRDKVVIRPLDYCGACPTCKAGYSHICQNLKFMGVDSEGAFQEFWTVPARTLHRLPEDMDLRDGALVEPLAVACHDVERGEVKPGDKAVVIGGGPIGLLVALAAKRRGAEVLVSEVSRQRLDLAAELGFRTVNPAEDDLESVVADFTGNVGADVTFEVSGTQAGADSITKITRPHGRIVVVAIFGEAPRVDLHKFFWKEYQIRGARVYEENDFDEAIAFLSEEKEKLRKLVTSVFSLDEIQQAFERIVDGRKEMKVLIRYE